MRGFGKVGWCLSPYSPGLRLIFVAFVLLLGLVVPVHAGPPLTVRVVEVPTPEHKPAASIVRVCSQVPPNVFLVVRATSSRSAWFSQYAYCGGDPVNRSDPSGLDWKWDGSAWQHVEGTPWVKPPPRGLTPDLMGGDDYYNIIDHIQVTATMNGLRGPVTREGFMQRLGAQRDYWNSREGSEQVVRINLAFAAWDHNALGFGDGGSLEGVLQGGIVDNIQAGGLASVGGYLQATAYNAWNGFSLGGLGREDRRVGGYNAALISEAQNAAMKSANRKSAAIDVALLAAGGWAGRVASTVRGGEIAVNAAGLTTRTIVAANTVNAGFATYGAYNVYEGVSTGNPVQATLGAVMAVAPVAVGSPSSQGALSSESRVTFYTVQGEASAARLRAGGAPWPGAPSSAHLGEGLYAWGTRGQAQAYMTFLQSRGVQGLQILEASLSPAQLRALKTMDVSLLDDAAASMWLGRHSRLFGDGIPHGLDHVIRNTGNFGLEFFFSKDIFNMLRIR